MSSDPSQALQMFYLAVAIVLLIVAIIVYPTLHDGPRN